ncbi:MAG: hypothetical protein QOD65_3525, partial [Gaiellales bacterium]|nr:hypothetical protein [Gaiellales bacterium]
MLQPIVAQFTSRGMPAAETRNELVKLAGMLRLWDEIGARPEHPGGDVSGMADITNRV